MKENELIKITDLGVYFEVTQEHFNENKEKDCNIQLE